MGQYYTVLIEHLCKDARRSCFEAFDPYQSGNTYKLLDHAWIGNAHVNTILNVLLYDQNTSRRVAWWGDSGTDYQEAVTRNKHLCSALDLDLKTLLYRKASPGNKLKMPPVEEWGRGIRNYVFEGLYNSIHNGLRSSATMVEEYANKVYDIARANIKSHRLEDTEMLFPDTEYFVVNWTKAQFIDMLDYYQRNADWDGSCLHPLPLLTAIGNGHGAGDYYGSNLNLCGSWALDKIAICMDRECVPPTCSEFKPTFRFH